MATSVITTAEIFLDTAYAIALSSPRDSFHAQAVRLAEEIEESTVRLTTTRAVLFEIGNALAAPRYRQGAVQLLTALEADERIDIVPLSQSLCERALQLYRNHTDKTWGLTDCASFVVMNKRKMTEALTTDRHFEQAGFRVLLREMP